MNPHQAATIFQYWWLLFLTDPFRQLNKGISNIAYNSLNLPSQLTINGVTSGSDITDYVGNKIYENGSLKRILVDGGYWESGEYHFYIQDHQGNNRVVVKGLGNGTVVQTNHYYPFGMTFGEVAASEQDKQAYKYNGKELDRKNGLNLYDYSARYMEPALGRFTTMDPLAEKYYSMSPYAYCANNPVRFVDPTGMFYTDYEIDKNGYIRRISEIDNKPDKLFGINQSTGVRENITVNDKEILSTLSGESSIQGAKAFATVKEKTIIKTVNGQRVVTKEKIIPMVNGHAAETNSQKDAKNVFIFASKTSNVEWAQANNKTGNSVVGTFHTNAQAPSFSSLGNSYSYENLIYYVHSHTGTNPSIDFKPSSYDILHARSLIKANPHVKVELFAPWKPDVKFINLNRYAE